MRVSKLRIGDLVYYDDGTGLKGKGLVAAINAWYVGDGCVDIHEKAGSTAFICPKDIIVKIVLREKLLLWWRYL